MNAKENHLDGQGREPSGSEPLGGGRERSVESASSMEMYVEQEGDGSSIVQHGIGSAGSEDENDARCGESETDGGRHGPNVGDASVRHGPADDDERHGPDHDDEEHGPDGGRGHDDGEPHGPEHDDDGLHGPGYGRYGDGSHGPDSGRDGGHRGPGVRADAFRGPSGNDDGQSGHEHAANMPDELDRECGYGMERGPDSEEDDARHAANGEPMA